MDIYRSEFDEVIDSINDIYVIIDSEGVYLYYSDDPRHHKKVPNSAIENEIAFEEFIKDFVREVKNGDHNKSERTDLSDMQSNDA